MKSRIALAAAAVQSAGNVPMRRHGIIAHVPTYEPPPPATPVVEREGKRARRRRLAKGRTRAPS